MSRDPRTWTDWSMSSGSDQDQEKFENLGSERTRTNIFRKSRTKSDGPWIPDCVKEEMSMIGKMIWISSLVIIVGICSSIFLSFRIVKTRSRLNMVNSSPDDNKPWVIYLFYFHAKRKSSLLELSAWSLASKSTKLSVLSCEITCQKFGESLYENISSESRKIQPVVSV